MDWIDALQEFRSRREPAVIVTLASVRGHAPRNGGAKMVVGATRLVGTVGGGNLEATAIERARAMLESGTAEPDLLTLRLTDKATAEYGVQCCGGEVTIMLEPAPVVPAVAIFGVGHVGLELARVLARHDLELTLIDSRAEMLDPARLGVPGATGILSDAVARVRVIHAPFPEAALADLPPGTHALVMTHDHHEDLAVIDQTLRTPHLGSIGLIGSRSKWARFHRKLASLGHSDADLLRVTTPIGIPEVRGKQPAVIAVSVAARLLQLIEAAAPVAVASPEPSGRGGTAVPGRVPEPAPERAR